jgi:DNA-binding cell septation regulator SpoVG
MIRENEEFDIEKIKNYASEQFSKLRPKKVCIDGQYGIFVSIPKKSIDSANAQDNFEEMCKRLEKKGLTRAEIETLLDDYLD